MKNEGLGLLQTNGVDGYTSFIAVREEVRNTGGSAKDINQPLPLPLGVSDMAVGSEPELVWLVTASLLIALIMMFRGRRRFV